MPVSPLWTEGAPVVAEIALVIASLVLLTVAADQLVVGAGRLATRLRLSAVVVGVVVIGVGTSAPELLVSAVAAARGDLGLAVGNIVGSNIINATWTLGISALIAPIIVRSSVIRQEAPLAVAAVVVFAIMETAGLGHISGVVLTVCLVGALALLVRFARAKTEPVLAAEVSEYLTEGTFDEQAFDEQVIDKRETEGKVPGAFGASLRAIVGLLGTLAGAHILVTNASHLATRLGVSQVVIGATIVAIGTTSPELVAAIQAQRRGDSDLVVGNLLGSNLVNSLAGGAMIGLAAPPHDFVDFPGSLVIAMVGVMIVSWIMLRSGRRVSRVEGGVLVAMYLAMVPLLLMA